MIMIIRMILFIAAVILCCNYSISIRYKLVNMSVAGSKYHESEFATGFGFG